MRAQYWIDFPLIAAIVTLPRANLPVFGNGRKTVYALSIILSLNQHGQIVHGRHVRCFQLATAKRFVKSWCRLRKF